MNLLNTTAQTPIANTQPSSVAPIANNFNDPTKNLPPVNPAGTIPLITPEQNRANNQATFQAAVTADDALKASQQKAIPVDSGAKDSYVDEKKKLESDYDKQTQGILDTLKNIQNGTVPLTPYEQTQLTETRKAFDDLRQQQELANQNYLGGVTRAQEVRGLSRYSPEMAQANIKAAVDENNKKISTLNSKAALALAEMQSGFMEKKYSQVKDQYNILQQIKKDKTEAIDKLYAKIEEENKKAEKGRKENEIAKLYSKGVTDVLTIQTTLKKMGIDIPAKEIGEYIKDVTPVGLDDLIKTMRQNGAPADLISKALTSKDINEAYNVAGAYASGGSGIIGEYNYAKANGYNGTFSQYQNEDANRKIRLAQAANAAGLTGPLMNTALKLSDDYETRSKDYYSQREAYNRVISSASDPSPAGDLALIFNYMKVLDPNSTVREGEFATAQNAGSAFNAIGAQYNKIVNGQRLTEVQRKDFVNRTTKLFEGAKAQQDKVAKEFIDRASKYGVPADLVVRDTSATGSRALEVVAGQKQDEEKLKNYVTTNPQKAAEIKNKIATIEQKTGKPLTATEFLQAFPEYNI